MVSKVTGLGLVELGFIIHRIHQSHQWVHWWHRVSVMVFG